MTGTNYILFKQCLNCFYLNSCENKVCSQCGYLFIEEANKEEEKASKAKLAAMKARSKDNI